MLTKELFAKSKTHVVLGLAIILFTFQNLFSQALLDPVSHPKFKNNLPIPARIDATNGRMYNIEMRETDQWLGLVDGSGHKLNTTIWGYGFPGQTVTTPGASFVAQRGVPIRVKWKNKLPKYNFPNGPGAHLLPVDPNIHIAHIRKRGIPTVAHLHGGHTESASDGLPEAWFTQGWRERGPHFVKKTYKYDNDQEAATLWYHDHALGITRLNVYAGLAGFYLLRDDNENQLIADNVLPNGPYEIEIVIQDRMFTEDGQLFYPSTDPEIEEPGFDPLPNGPSVIAEFFGDFILVNGIVWPKLSVEARKYRFRLLNGSDSRFYILKFDKSILFYQIGTDDGLLPKPVRLNRLLIAPGERADVVVDFTGKNRKSFILQNVGPDDPFKGFGIGGKADPRTTGQIMKFIVNKRSRQKKYRNASITPNTRLRPNIQPLTQDGATRQLVLFEGLDRYGRLQPLLGTMDEGSLAWFEPITENPMVNDVEVWEVFNATEDAHPIHLHLVSFQIVNRQSFAGTVEEKAQIQHDGSYGVGGKLTVTGLGGSRGPEPNEVGWKDTAVMMPGEVTRVIAKFDRKGRYVWHCHILSHEDHEMMRPFYVGNMGLSKPIAYEGESLMAPVDYSLEQNHPNPFNPTTEIRFQLPASERVTVKIYNPLGEEVRTLVESDFVAGYHSITWDATNNNGISVPSGTYLYKLKAGNFTQTKRMTLLR